MSPAKRERCFALLAAGGDVWACVLELNAIRRASNRHLGGHLDKEPAGALAEGGARPIASYQALCRELSLAGRGVSASCRRWRLVRCCAANRDAFFAAAKARRAGDASMRYPRWRRHLMSLGFYAGTFSIEGRRVTLPVARGRPAARRQPEAGRPL